MLQAYRFSLKTGGQEIVVRRVSPLKLPRAAKKSLTALASTRTPREKIVADNRKDSTQAYVRHSEFGSPRDRQARATIITLAFDRNLRNAEAVRRAVEMMRQIEQHARENGMKRLDTTGSILSPQFVLRQFGLTLESSKLMKPREGKPYRIYYYSKEL